MRRFSLLCVLFSLISIAPCLLADDVSPDDNQAVLAFQQELQTIRAGLDSAGQAGNAAELRDLSTRLLELASRARRALPMAEFNSIKKQVHVLRKRVTALRRSAAGRPAPPNRPFSIAVSGEGDQRPPLKMRGINNSAFLDGAIAGTVSDSLTIAALQGVHIDVYDSSGDWYNHAISDADGHYTCPAAPGAYFAKTWSNIGYVDELYDNIPCEPGCEETTGTPIQVSDGSTTNVDFALDPEGAISGTVKDSVSGEPIANAHINVYGPNGDLLRWQTTDSSGNYMIANLIPGVYFSATSSAGAHLNQLYDHLPCDASCNPTSGTAIAVTSGTTTGQIDFDLIPWGSISGTIIDATTQAPISNAEVDLGGGYSFSGRTDQAGHYSIQAPGGTYFVHTHTSTQYVDEIYDNLVCEDSCDSTSGTPVTVVNAADTPGIDFQLDHGGSISGRVTSRENGEPLCDRTVSAASPHGVSTTVVTDTQGRYRLTGLPAGLYYINTNGRDEYVNEVYDGLLCGRVCDPTIGTPVAVIGSAETPEINFELPLGGSISGIVKDAGTNSRIRDVGVGLSDANGRYVAESYTDGTGSYRIAGLAPGNYFASTSTPTAHIDEIYDNIQCPSSCDRLPPGTGTPIAVNLGQNTGIDFALNLGGRVSGIVRDSITNEPVSDVEVDIYDSDGYYAAYAYTDGTGKYMTEGGLMTRNYFATSYSDGMYLDELYDNIPCAEEDCDPTQGTPIPVVAGSVTEGINFGLGYGGSAAGMVTDAATGAPINDISIDMYDSTGEWLEYGYGYSDWSGHYRANMLPPGVCYGAAEEQDAYFAQLYHDIACQPDCDPRTGTPINITESNVTWGIDYPLHAGGVISGVVTDSSGLPLRGVGLGAYDSTGKWTSSSHTDVTGQYRISRLPAGTYFVICQSRGHAGELYDNIRCPGGQCDRLSGTPVPVSLGSETPGINFVLDPCTNVAFDPLALPDGATGNTYSQAISVSGLSSPAIFTWGSGMVPPGLSLNGDGLLAGTPLYPGTYRFDVRATDPDYCWGSRVYDMNVTGCPAITLLPSKLPDGIARRRYSRTIVSDTGERPLTFSVTAGPLPPGLSLDGSGLLSGTPVSAGGFTFTITATDSNGCSGSRQYTIAIAESCLFCDDFEDAVLDPNWEYLKGSWVESDGALAGTPVARKALAVADPAFSAGCSVCNIEATVMTLGGEFDKVWLLGWYGDGSNDVELLVVENENKLVLKQRVGGAVVAKAKAKKDIAAGQFYNIRIDFDGNDFAVTVDGTVVIRMPKADGTSPAGTVGFQVKNTTARFGSVIVN